MTVTRLSLLTGASLRRTTDMKVILGLIMAAASIFAWQESTDRADHAQRQPEASRSDRDQKPSFEKADSEKSDAAKVERQKAEREQAVRYVEVRRTVRW